MIKDIKRANSRELVRAEYKAHKAMSKYFDELMKQLMNIDPNDKYIRFRTDKEYISLKSYWLALNMECRKRHLQLIWYD